MKKPILLGVFFLLTLPLWSQAPAGVPGCAVWLVKSGNSVARVQAPQVNGNPVFTTSGKKVRFKGLSFETFSLFAVIHSETAAELPLLQLKEGGGGLTLTNKGIVRHSEIEEKIGWKGNVAQGVILSYVGGRLSSKKASLLLENLTAAVSGANTNNVFELLLYPKAVTAEEQRKIETYLSIKYGMSLDRGHDYADADGKILWDAEKNARFDYRVTGIAVSKRGGLNQIRSANAAADGISIGFVEPKDLRGDTPYVLWGDDDRSWSFDANVGGEAKFAGRHWWLQASSDEVVAPLRVELDKRRIPALQSASQNSETLWMAIFRDTMDLGDVNKAKIIQATTDNDTIIRFTHFNKDIVIGSGVVFTFFRAPAFFASGTVTSACDEKTAFEIQFHGGTPPFTVTFEGDGHRDPVAFGTRFGRVADLAPGHYKVTVTDAEKAIYTDEIEAAEFGAQALALDPVYVLDAKKGLRISPVVPSDATLNGWRYEWSDESGVLSTATAFTPDRPGNYFLNIEDAKGCSRKIAFRVESPSDVSVYPNPARAGADIYLDFAFKEERNVTVLVYDAAGKRITRKALGKIRSEVYAIQAPEPGSYLFVMEAEGQRFTQKVVTY